jgi:hypothetical protein
MQVLTIVWHPNERWHALSEQDKLSIALLGATEAEAHMIYAQFLDVAT